MLHPKLVGQRLAGMVLVRSGARTDGLVGSEITGVEARGKNLLVHFGVGWSLHVHLKMNGRVRLYPRASAPRVPMSATSAVFDTEQHRVMVYTAPIARVLRTRDLIGDLHFRGLGPDLLGEAFELGEACRRLALQKKRPLGEAIMDQGVVAGIGNVWKSELCFTLRLDPFAAVEAHTEAEQSGLISLARTQMFDNVYGPKSAIPDPFAAKAERQARLDRRQGEHVLSVYEREGKACYDCGTLIEMRRQGEQHRSTYYCPSCQPSRGAS